MTEARAAINNHADLICAGAHALLADRKRAEVQRMLSEGAAT